MVGAARMGGSCGTAWRDGGGAEDCFARVPLTVLNDRDGHLTFSGVGSGVTLLGQPFQGVFKIGESLHAQPAHAANEGERPHPTVKVAVIQDRQALLVCEACVAKR